MSNRPAPIADTKDGNSYQDVILQELLQALKHGFFEFKLTGELIQGGKRKLIFKAGKSHQFIIPAEDL